MIQPGRVAAQDPPPEARREPGSFRVEAPGLGEARPPDPCVMVIFGAGGDLTRRQLIPALFELACKDLLPERFAVVGFSRGEMSDQAFREAMRESACQECHFRENVWEELAPRLFYACGDFESPPEGDYRRLAEKIAVARRAWDIADNVFFHLAAPPSFFGTIAGRLAASGLAASEGGWRRLVVEKPFGHDLASARALDRQLREAFEEQQIYRIDHFLGKETVQNMLAFRFANPSFEPIWNRNYIDHVQITVAEQIGIEGRAGFYERTGVVRDMVQNHLLQLLCMTAIEPPVQYDGRSLRDETLKVLQAIRHSPLDPATDAVGGQYEGGEVDGRSVPAYGEEPGVAPDSSTPTFAALRLTLDNWRWAGVPFYVRTGKRMARKLSEVVIEFRPTPHLMFPREAGAPLHGHLLVFRLQPEEGIEQTFIAKRPGPRMRLCPVTMQFRYATAFGVSEPPRAYAWLLRDVMEADPTLFARSDWIEEAWRIVDPLVERWESGGKTPEPYPAGSWGPPGADRLVEREGRQWRVI